MRLFLVEVEGAPATAWLLEEVHLGCRGCLRRALLAGFGSLFRVRWAETCAAAPGALLLAALRNLLWTLPFALTAPTRWLRGALHDAGIRYRDFLVGFELGDPRPPLTTESQVELARSLVLLLRTVAVSLGPGDEKQWRSLRGYLRFYFESQPEVFAAADPGETPLAPPLTEDLLAACAAVRRLLGTDDHYLLLYMMLGVAGRAGRVSAEVRARLVDIAIECGVDRRKVDNVLGAAEPATAEPEPEPDDPSRYEHLESSDPWTVLGLERDASPSQIRKRYLQLVLEHHPDRHAHLGPAYQDAADRRLRRINAAYRRVSR